MTKRGETFAALIASVAALVFLSIFFGGLSYTMLCGIAGLPASFAENGYAGWLASPAGFFVGFLLALVVHEFAHALSVRLVGGHIYSIILGKGPLLVQFPVMGTRCYVFTSLMGGAVQYGLTSPGRLRSKFAIITASAPLASLALCAVCVSLTALFVQNCSEFPVIFVAFSIGMTAGTIFLLPGTLLPFTFTFQGRPIKSDALKLLSIPWMTDKEIARHISRNQSTIEAARPMDKSIASLQTALARSEAEPSNPNVMYTAAQYLRVANDDRTVTYFRRLLDLPAASPEDRELYLDGYLTTCLEFDRVRGNAEADSFSQELLALKPNDPSVQGTRGSVLIDLGRVEEGKSTLTRLLNESDHPTIRAYSHLFLALCEKQAGNLDAARVHARKAKKEEALNGPALKRVADLLKPSVQPKL